MKFPDNFMGGKYCCPPNGRSWSEDGKGPAIMDYVTVGEDGNQERSTRQLIQNVGTHPILELIFITGI